MSDDASGAEEAGEQEAGETDTDANGDGGGVADGVDGVDVDWGLLGNAVGGALILAWYATWITADLLARWLIFPLVALLAGYLLYQKDSGHAQGVYFGYRLAVLVLVTPLLLVLPDVLGAEAYGVGGLTLLFTYTNILLGIVFAILAGIIAYVTYRYDGGTGLVARVRRGGTVVVDRVGDRASD